MQRPRQSTDVLPAEGSAALTYGDAAKTIYALSTAPVQAGLAVVRVSGSHARDALEHLAGIVPPPRTLSWRRLKKDGQLLDQALVVWFEGPHSFTGEDVVEFHVHGSAAVIEALLGALGGCSGLRVAHPGEFSRRAFENGKMDLTQAEGLAELIKARTQAQHQQAMRQLEGEARRLYEGWREQLLRSLARLEAVMEFPEDVEGQQPREAALRGAEVVYKALQQHLAQAHRSQSLRDGVDMVLLGPPNAGKSSLFNLFNGRSAALVSPQPGTTRDVLETPLELGGLPVVLKDTAGLGLPEDELVAAGIRRAEQAAQSAQVRLVVWARDSSPQEVEDVRRFLRDGDIAICNKKDLPARFTLPSGVLEVSARTQEGVEELWEALEKAAHRCVGCLDSPLMARARHLEALEEASEALGRLEKPLVGELQAEEVRLALGALGRLVGDVGVEEVLDTVFAEFCVGK